MSDTHVRILRAVHATEAGQHLAALPVEPGASVRVGGIVGSADAALVAALSRARPRHTYTVVAATPAAAIQIQADLRVLLDIEVPLFPQREALPYEPVETHVDVSGMRVEAVEALLSGRARVIVTTVRALQEKTPVPLELVELRVELTSGEPYEFRTLVERLESLGFERVPLVEEVGQFAVRGGIVDVFSFGAPEPVRVEFWGDEIESLRHFDVLDQRSIRTLERVLLLPPRFPDTQDHESTRRSLLDLLPAPSWLVAPNGSEWERAVSRTWEQVRSTGEEFQRLGRDVPAPETLMLDPEAFATARSQHHTLELSEASGDPGLDLGTVAAPTIDRDMARLRQLLEDGAEQGMASIVLCDNTGQLERLDEILEQSGGTPVGAELATGSVARGFEVGSGPDRVRVFTDHEVFRRTRRIRRGRRFRGAVALESLSQLQTGDFVVHMDHGIGRFRGLERLEVAGDVIEVLAVEYAGDEVLRVPVYRLDLLERWVGDPDSPNAPSVHRIGGKRWKAVRSKTRAAIEKMAVELLELYARREAAQGHAFPPDTRWQKEMESAFLFEDTPDQRQATIDVKGDMESARPMDRLVCGDVGYGKTEVAIRAAFKAVQDGKQVGVLAPTTILVEQHRNTITQRLADYPVRIESLSRFRSAGEQARIMEELASGGVDIVIGTHRLLSPDVRFKDLGLLIVDEEQRFGVKHKERLKELKSSIDVLTLTATPIPRTLHQALGGLRDLSVIRTPPRDRMPIVTHVVPWSDQILGDAVRRELDRGGQTYVLYNRVETIDTAAARVQRLAPDARVAIAHGQMPTAQLDKHMRAFVDGETDILVCSSIIENGLDVPNANTLIVDGADRFGLSQLYQIRGRVGRSDRRAYCYLVVPESINEQAERRLRVLEHFTELGSGYAIAMKDLEQRGAGNLLGGEQSGFANQMGMDAYMRLLRRTIQSLKDGDHPVEHPDAEVSLDVPAFLPDGYIPDSSQKLHLYRRLSRARSREELNELSEEIRDRYGPLPEPVATLLDQAALRVLGGVLGVERVFVRKKQGRITYRPGVVPRLAGLDRPFADRQIDVEIRRMEPLSLALTTGSTEPLVDTLIDTLEALAQATRDGEPGLGGTRVKGIGNSQGGTGKTKA